MPKGRWSWRQSWRDLVFAHWPVSVLALRDRIPAQLEIDTFEGQAWLGVVPFHMNDIALRGLPPVPGTSAFPELNLRTYVTLNGKPGVWFFSLDADHHLAVWAARRFFHLPYFYARMNVDRVGPTFRYSSHRSGSEEGVFRAHYTPQGKLPPTKPGSLDHWLTERYCLYCVDPTGNLLRGEVHHRPWALQGVELEIEENRLLGKFGIDSWGSPSLVHFSERIDVVLWPLRPSAE